MKTIVLIYIALIVITLGVYMQVGNHPFVNIDDYGYVVNNPHVAKGVTGKNIIWAFTSLDQGNWHPITWLSHMADVQFHGMNPSGHHITNVFIHTLSTLLLLCLLLRLTGALWQSTFVATLFALHPLHVESVAWVAERKDVLSGCFFFITLIFYSEFVAKRKKGLYLISLFSFVCGLMSKPMLVTLPIVMLLLDFWPLDRYPNEEQGRTLKQQLNRVMTLIKEKIPFFACSAFSGAVTIYAQHKGGAMSGLHLMPLQFRIENYLIACVKYISKTLWPHDLAVYYPMPLYFSLWQVIGSLLVLTLLSAATVLAKRRHPYLVVGWFWFLATLVPVIGIIQVGNQSMADRYTYIPIIGLFIMVAWGVQDMTSGLQHRRSMLALLAGSIIIASAALTWQQLGYWRNSTSLFQHTLQVTTSNASIHSMLGGTLDNEGDLDAAIHEYLEALRISPGLIRAHNNLGLALAKKGYLDEAIKEFQEELRINPNATFAHVNLGNALAIKGNLDAAIHQYQEALRINPDDKDAHYNLGLALAPQPPRPSSGLPGNR